MKQELNRRQWIAGSAGAALLSGCNSSRPPEPPGPPPRVLITRQAAYDQTLYEAMRRVIAAHAVDVRGLTVVLKPNLVEFEPESTINTHPLLVHAIYEAFRAAGAAAIHIAEGPGHRRNTLDLADAAGYFSTIPKFEDLFVDLNHDDVTRVHLATQLSGLPKIYLTNTILGAGLLVSIPKMKTHHLVGATLSMKNLFGTVPGAIYGWPKNALHWAGIPQCIVDLHHAYPRRLAIVDGIVAMDGNGPIQGDPKPAGVVVSGADSLAVDATCCRIMGINPYRISYLRLAAASASQLAEQSIQQIGEPIASVANPFTLIREFQSLRLAP